VGHPNAESRQSPRPSRARPAACACLALAALLLLAPAGASAQDGTDAEESEWGYALASELMSPYCPGRTLPDCPSPQAAELREWIVAQEEAGRSQQEVRQQLLARFGDQLLQSPRAEGFGLVAYLLPAAALVAGGWLLLAFLRRQRAASSGATPPRLSAVDPELERQVEDEIRRAREQA